MRYTLEEITTFLTVMELGTVTAAAARLNLSKSVISKRISDLELGLGVALFRRNAGRITPTEAAARLAARMRPALAELSAAAESAAWGGESPEVLRGKLSISAPMTFGTMYLSGIIARFSAQHPELELRVDYDDRVRDLQRDGFDLGIRIGDPRDSALMQRKLCDDISIPCASPAFLDRYGRPESIEDLSGLPVMGYSYVSNADVWRFHVDGQDVAPHLREVMSLNNGQAMRDLAIHGLAMAYLPQFIVAEALANGQLEHVLPEIETRKLSVLAVWPAVQPMPSKLRRFIDHLAVEFADGAPWLKRKA